MYGRVSFLFLASGSQTRKVPSATALIHFSFFVNSMELVLDQSSINEMSFDLRNFKFSDCPFDFCPALCFSSLLTWIASSVMPAIVFLFAAILFWNLAIMSLKVERSWTWKWDKINFDYFKMPWKFHQMNIKLIKVINILWKYRAQCHRGISDTVPYCFQKIGFEIIRLVSVKENRR